MKENILPIGTRVKVHKFESFKYAGIDWNESGYMDQVFDKQYDCPCIIQGYKRKDSGEIKAYLINDTSNSNRIFDTWTWPIECVEIYKEPNIIEDFRIHLRNTLKNANI